MSRRNSWRNEAPIFCCDEPVARDVVIRNKLTPISCLQKKVVSEEEDPPIYFIEGKDAKNRGKNPAALFLQKGETKKFLQIIKPFIKDSEPKQNDSVYAVYMKWLLKKSKSREASIVCPECNKRLVTHFAVYQYDEGFCPVGDNYICCGEEECMKKIRAKSPDDYLEILPVEIESINSYWFRTEHTLKKAMTIYRRVFGLDRGTITVKRAHDFFCN